MDPYNAHKTNLRTNENRRFYIFFVCIFQLFSVFGLLKNKKGIMHAVLDCAIGVFFLKLGSEKVRKVNV